MQFDSITFIVFFISVLTLYYVLRSVRQQKSLLLFASIVFYAAWNPYFIFLIAFSTLLDWQLAKKIIFSNKQKTKRNWLLLSLTSNLGLLGYFKYGEFLLQNFQKNLLLTGVNYQAPAVDIILPIGISFYTFQTLSYTIDVYRGKIKEPAPLLDFALYVSFFPQLVAGPIVRSNYFLPQCHDLKRFDTWHIGWGIFLLVSGLFAKVVLSDVLLAPFVDAVYQQPFKVGTVEAWAAVFAFSGQVFFDFSGYSLCAIGAAFSLGFSLPRNFNSPYAAISFSDFWRRWHISLSSWLRDYLYIPLGGSRNGELRTYLSLSITMLLGGLWHGASWQFVIWGALHGCYLVIERLLGFIYSNKTPSGDLYQLTVAVLIFVLVSITWIFFRAEDMTAVSAIFQALFHYQGNSIIIYDVSSKVLQIFILISLLFSFHWYSRNTSFLQIVESFPGWLKAVCLIFMMLGITLISSGDERAFIYFQF